jgi:hypothetical protein
MSVIRFSFSPHEEYAVIVNARRIKLTGVSNKGILHFIFRILKGVDSTKLKKERVA